MSLPVGGAVAQGIGVPVEFRIVDGIKQRTWPGLVAAANRGTAIKMAATPVGSVDIATDASVPLIGVLGQDVYDPTGIPASVARNIWADGILTFSQTNQPTSVWKIGEFFVTNVSGVVAPGDFLAPTTNGAWVSSTTTNNVKNGAVICTVGNDGVAGGPIQISVNIA